MKQQRRRAAPATKQQLRHAGADDCPLNLRRSSPLTKDDIGNMLDPTAKDVGATRRIYDKAVALSFVHRPCRLDEWRPIPLCFACAFRRSRFRNMLQGTCVAFVILPNSMNVGSLEPWGDHHA